MVIKLAKILLYNSTNHKDEHLRAAEHEDIKYCYKTCM